MTAVLPELPALRRVARPACPVCGAAGKALHAQQRDRLFGAPGLWNTQRCTGARCDAAWLDPAPHAADLGLAYADYYTHHEPAPARRPGRAKSAYLWLRRGYLAGRFGYDAALVTPWHARLGRVLYLWPLRRASIDEELRWLPARPGGTLLDVGCGSGEWLASMRRLGWQVDGVDFDERAVRQARASGLAIGLGDVEAQAYADGRFDVVTLNHVVEHLPDALATLRECRRVLRPGGTLVVCTPNGASLGHAVFGADWRGLEPPRHLQLYGPQSLAALLAAAGFVDGRVTTAGSRFYWRHSLALWHAGRAAGPGEPRWLAAAAFALAALAHGVGTVDNRRGESVVAHATRT